MISNLILQKLGSIFFRSLFWFNLISLTFHKNSNHERENYWKSGAQIPAPEGQKMFALFSFHFQILHTKIHIFLFNRFLISCFLWSKRSIFQTFWKPDFGSRFLFTLRYLINEYTRLTIQCLAPSSCQS